MDVNAPLESGELPLHVALKKQDTEEVKRLLAAGADPNLMSKDSSMGLSLTPLEVALASGKGEMDCILALLEAGAKVGEEAELDAASTRYPQYLRAITAARPQLHRFTRKRRGGKNHPAEQNPESEKQAAPATRYPERPSPEQ